METTNNKLPEKVERFFKELSEYLDTKLLYYGSVQRRDYFEGKSDIDVDIFTENPTSTVNKLQHFLDVPKKRFKNVIWRLDDNNKLIGYHGYTHRGGQTFKIGDRLFDGNYKPQKEDYEEWEWTGWEYKYLELYGKSDALDKKWMRESGISYVIPYKKRGKKVIENMDECLQAAINMSKDLS